MTNMTGFEDANNIFEMYGAVNTGTGNILVILTLVSVFVILTIALLRRNPPAESVTAASAVSTVLSLIFLALGVAAEWWVVTFGIIFAISGVALYLNNR